MVRRTLNEEFLAEIDISLENNLPILKTQIKNEKNIQKDLKKMGFYKPIPSKSEKHTSFPLIIASISIQKKIKFSDWGNLISLHIYGVIIKYSDFDQISEMIPISNFKIVNQDYKMIGNITEFYTYNNILELVLELLMEYKPNYIIIDSPILINDMSFIKKKFYNPTNHKINQIKNEINVKWKKINQLIFPVKENGTIILNLSKGFPIYSSTIIGKSKYSKNIFNKLNEYLKDHQELEKINVKLNNFERTVAFSFYDLQFYPYFPKETEGLDLIFLKLKLKNNKFDLIFFGNKGKNNSIINEICSILIELSFNRKKNDIPFPLWYSRKKVKFPEIYLDYYIKKMKKMMMSNG